MGKVLGWALVGYCRTVKEKMVEDMGEDLAGFFEADPWPSCLGIRRASEQ